MLPHPHYLVNILTDGSVVVKGKPMDLAALQQMLAGDGDVSKTDVTIAADQKVPFQDFVHVMDSCQKAGVTSIGIATKASA
jgi:Biopolymer transport protein